MTEPYITTVGKFYDGDYPQDTEHRIYILWYGKAGDQCLYVGLSRDNLWNRWFSCMGNHLSIYDDGHIEGWTQVGQAIARNLPESLDWEIEFREGDYDNLEKIEADLIKGLRALFNTVHGAALNKQEIKLKNDLLHTLDILLSMPDIEF